MPSEHTITAPPYSRQLHTPLVDILGCTFPVLCAGMGGVARARLAAAVSEAGGFGCMGMVREKPAFIREQVQLYRSLSQQPFAVNIIPAATDAGLLQAQVDMLIQLNVPAVCLFWDSRPAIMRQFREAGITVMHQVGSEKDAEQALAAGADILIAQGVEAGGHVRGEQSLFTLLPDLCRLSPVPVVAAGGIANGAGLAAALRLGAQGVCCGSAFLATFESNAHDFHKQQLLQAHADDTVYTRLFHINWPEAAPVRVLRNCVEAAMAAADSVTADAPLQAIGEQDGQPVYLFSTDSPLAGARGELDKMALYAGRSCTDIHNLCSAADRVRQLVDEALDALGESPLANAAPHTASAAIKVSSSPCLADESTAAYAGHCDDEELYALLLELLAAERAGAKVCACSLTQAGLGQWHTFLLQIHQDEVKSCEGLIRSIRTLGRQPHRQTGDFFEKCMAIRDIDARMQLLNKGQAWVVKKISAILPRVGQPDIFRQLSVMRDEHRHNIELANRYLAERTH